MTSTFSVCQRLDIELDLATRISTAECYTSIWVPGPSILAILGSLSADRTETGLDLGTPDNLALTEHIFAAKDVPLGLIPRIPEHRDFHHPDWPRVQATVSGPLESFDFYFDAVVWASEALQPLWEE